MHKRFLVGFTVAELLLVITVIGIIAAITIVSYNGVQRKGDDGAVQDNLSKISDQLNTYYTDNGIYPTADSALSGVGFKVNRASYDNTTTSGAMVYCSDLKHQIIAVLARSKSGRAYYFVSDGPVLQFTGTYPVLSGIPNVASACDPLLGAPTDTFTWIKSGGGTSGTWNYSF